MTATRNGGMAQAAGIAAPANLEAVEMSLDPGAQRVVEPEAGHDGLLNVHTTAGGTLRQMRRPRAATRWRFSRRPRGTGGVGP
jgi:hypothetical protein